MVDLHADTPVVIASNRGPVSHRRDGDDLVAVRGGGGLISGLRPLLDSGRAVWIAAALSEADRAAARNPASVVRSDVDHLDAVHLLDVDDADFDRYYDVVANSFLWFVHHASYHSSP